MKEVFDFSFSLVGIIILIPLLVFIAIIIVLDSKGSPLFLQNRVGKDERIFRIVKFRTMYSDRDHDGMLTIGEDDHRITKIGFYLRRYKLDELPQLFNVLIGDMSFVGPRPEIPYFTKFYTKTQKIVFSVKPGITDYASLKYIDENEQLRKVNNPEEYYIKYILQDKLAMNIDYIQNRNFIMDCKIILLTIKKIIKT